MRARGAVPSGPPAGGWATRPGGCSLKGGDGLHPSVKVVDEYLARRVLTGDTSGVLDRVVELRVEVEVLSTPPARVGAVFVFDHPKEVRAQRTQLSSPPAERLGPDVLSFEGNGRQGGPG
jgi:hypothetical protein